MDNTSLISIIQSHRKDSLGYESGQLSQERAAAMDHYHGRPYGNEIEGRSAVVSRDLAETVDWALPAIMRVFVQSGNLAEFSPVDQDDEQLALQETDYTNQVIMKDNPGFMILHDAIKDTLLLKNGYVKHWWEVEDKITQEEFSGLTMDQIVKLQQDLEADGAEVTVKGQDSRMIPTPGMDEPNEASSIMANPAQPGMIEIFDLELQIKRKCGKVCIEAVPSEEVRVSRKCRGSLQDSPFTEHVTMKTRSELIEMGMPRNFVDDLPAFRSSENSQEVIARDSVTDENTQTDGSAQDRSMDEIEFCEAYLKVDFDGDGVAELRKVVTVANKIPPGEEWNEPIEAVALTGFVMKRVPHRHIGESLDDEIADIQEIKTALERQLLDNIYLTNNQRVFINERVNTKDLLTSTPGGAIRVRGEGPVGDSAEPFVVAPILDKILPAIDYWDKTKENRSGIRPGSDLDPEVLQEVTKGAFMESMNRLSQKIEMMARLLAESGVKDMVLQVHDLLIRHQDRPRMVQMRGKWVTVDPTTWKSRTDLNVKVGLGTGNEEEKRQKLTMLAQGQGQLLQAVGVAPPAVYAKMYALFEDMAKTLGVEAPDKYGIAPNSQEYQQIQQQAQSQPNPEVAKEQAKGQVTLQVEAAKGQQAMKSKQAELQLQATNDERDAAREMAQFERELALKREQMAYDDQRHQREMSHKQWESQLAADTQIAIARIKGESTIDAAQLAAQATLSAQQEQASDVAVSNEGPIEEAGPHPNVVLASAMQGMTQALQGMNRPRTIVRGPDGKATGLE